MDTEDQKNDYNRHRHNGRIWGGLFLLALGGIFLMKELAFPFFPSWFFSWPMILIAVGVFSGLRQGFHGGGWLVIMLVGGFFLLDQMDIGINVHRYIVPFVIILIGLTMILRPRRNRDDRYWDRRYHRHRRDWNDWGYNRQERTYTPPPTGGPSFSSGPNPGQGTNPGPGTNAGPTVNPGPGPNPNFGPGPTQTFTSTEDYLDSTSVFGGVRKVIMSKNFKGGEATSVMGGTELDFTQADINGVVVLELTQVLGGAKLIVPGHWTIRNEVNAVLGGVDDKRNLHAVADPNKVLVIKGTSFLGGLEIRNY